VEGIFVHLVYIPYRTKNDNTNIAWLNPSRNGGDPASSCFSGQWQKNNNKMIYQEMCRAEKRIVDKPIAEDTLD
jgi:hypothetical protein